MDPVTGSVLTALVGLGVHVVAVVRQEVGLRWQARQEKERRHQLALLAGVLPPGCRLVEVRGDGSEVQLVIGREGGDGDGDAGGQTRRPAA